MQSGQRIIFHCDCNNFFASCESIDHPEYKTVPMAVAGDPEARKGVVVAKNDLAKKYGVKTTDTVWMARQKCPNILFVPPTPGLYGTISKRVNAIYYEYTDLVEPASIDESYLDLTHVPQLSEMNPRQFADMLRRRIKNEIGITISVGASYNKTFAKIGSDYKKPDATTVITPENFREIVWPLPVGDMMYVGKASADRLNRVGVMTIGQMASLEPETLVRLLGKGGETLWRNANGLDDDPVIRVEDRPEIKSVSRGQTFPRDLTEEDDIRQGMIPLTDEISATLRRHRLKGGTVVLQIKDPDLNVISRQMKLAHRTNLYSEITAAATELFRQQWRIGPDHPVRAFTIGVTDLVPSAEAAEQLSLFEDSAITGKSGSGYLKRENQEKIEDTIDRLRNKFGNSAFAFGGAVTKTRDEVCRRQNHRDMYADATTPSLPGHRTFIRDMIDNETEDQHGI